MIGAETITMSVLLPALHPTLQLQPTSIIMLISEAALSYANGKRLGLEAVQLSLLGKPLGRSNGMATWDSMETKGSGRLRQELRS